MAPSPDQAGLARFLSVADTAELLGLAPSEVLAMIASGELPAIQVGAHGKWRIERTVLESVIDDKYEQTRRMALWNEANLASIAEIGGGRILPTASTPI